ncbi:hypothetical protein QJQ45_018726 [Haematococcus lacustris]|nr:hypothetical protein QJQ45_018726 [Haematococcus lacustris]
MVHPAASGKDLPHIRHDPNVLERVSNHQQSGLLLFSRPATFAVLSQKPESHGHALLVVKHAAATILEELPPDVAQGIIPDLRVLARAVQKAAGCTGLRIVQENGAPAGQTVPQLHFQLIPCYAAPSTPTSQQADGTPISQLTSDQAGPLVAAIQNALPDSHAPGFHFWAGCSEQQEEFGGMLCEALGGSPGSVVLLKGELGAGKSTIARGFVRAFCCNPMLEVPSPTFLLCLSYNAEEGQAADTVSQQLLPPEPAMCQASQGSRGEGAQPQHPVAQQGKLPPAAEGLSGCHNGTDDVTMTEVQASSSQQQQQQQQGAANSKLCATPELPMQAACAPVQTAAPSQSVQLPNPQGSEEQGSIPSSSSSGVRPAGPICSLHHIDPYRLGTKVDKMAGLLDWAAAFQRDVCLVEWPDRMPRQVMALPHRGCQVLVSGMGAQAGGRLINLTPLTPDDPCADVIARLRATHSSRQQQQQQPAAAAASQALGQSSGTVGYMPPGLDPTPCTGNGQLPSRPPSLGTDQLPHGVSGASAHSPALQADQADAQGVQQASRLPVRPAGPAAPSTLLSKLASLGVRETDPTKWLVLGIESSCDDTAAAVVRGDGCVLGQRIASQVGLHEVWGGVKPDVARDAHAAAITATVDDCLAAAGVAPHQLTAVAVTVGPGLSLCLQVGIRHGLRLAARHGLPFIPVHHMEAHALTARLPSLGLSPAMTFPALVLLVSGGHNLLVLVEGVGRHRLLGTTLDDSLGESFDKIARLLGITVIPGGPLLEALAAKGDASRFKMPLPLQTGAHKVLLWAHCQLADSCNFSFSGLKTAVSRLLQEEEQRLGAPLSSARAPPPTTNPGCDAAAPSSSAGGSTPCPAAPAQLALPSTGSCPGPGTPTACLPAQPLGSSAPAAPTETDKPGPTSPHQDTCKSPAAPAADAGGSAPVESPTLADQLSRSAADIAAAFQKAAVAFLQQRTRRALSWLQEDQRQGGGPAVSCLVVAGGVAANKAVRAGLASVAQEADLPLVCPPPQYCTDNGLMVAWTGIERLQLGLAHRAPRDEESAEKNVEVLPRWPLGPMDPRSLGRGQKYVKMFH